jgi:DUF4097 and DUF4098 domain-containing protein YvlB
MKTRVLTAAFVLLACGTALAQQRPISRTFSSDQTFGLAPNGTFYLENPSGNIIIDGKDTPNVEAMLFKTITGADKDAVDEGRRQTTLIVGGDNNGRSVRTTIAAGSTRGWSASVSWRIKVPRTANVRILSSTGDHIQITGMRSGVQVKNFNGKIVLTDVVGAAIAESVNGSVYYQSPQIRGNVLLSTVNGSIVATVPPQAGFRWIAETLKGDIKTNLPARGTFLANTFNGTVNAPGGPTITTASLMGDVHLYEKGRPVRYAQSLRKSVPVQAPPMQRGGSTPQQRVVRGHFQFTTSLGNVAVQQILGDANIFTGAGEVQLGAVSGACRIRSGGGPLQLGEVFGPLDLETRAGDIMVDTARRGGTIHTRGGTIRLLYTSGATRLISGGGDIHVRQAAAPVNAETASGDIAISVDAASKSQRVDAKTAKGNVTLNVSPQFAGEIDATILTDDPDADTFLSDIPGLSVSRDQVGGKTRVRATGRINGGGEKVVLHAIDGDIRISTGPVPPTVVSRK